jgi:hypothetical protein
MRKENINIHNCMAEIMLCFDKFSEKQIRDCFSCQSFIERFDDNFWIVSITDLSVNLINAEMFEDCPQQVKNAKAIFTIKLTTNGFRCDITRIK